MLACIINTCMLTHIRDLLVVLVAFKIHLQQTEIRESSKLDLDRHFYCHSNTAVYKEQHFVLGLRKESKCVKGFKQIIILNKVILILTILVNKLKIVEGSCMYVEQMDQCAALDGCEKANCISCMYTEKIKIINL